MNMHAHTPLVVGITDARTRAVLALDDATRRRHLHVLGQTGTGKSTLLQYMIAHPNVPIPHTKLLQAVWGPDYGDEVEYLRVFIRHLRKKIEPDPAKPRYILTDPWVGYRFVPDA